ncbi:polyketide synthase [Xylophilus sp. GOD-11R]|uniref:polyketide synthase n=1 Tax=Xylophilus sp. GOD-11R TaxID=3089814 RepID=UPI00298C6FCD|nr:polyketide synthase [Xylophilus sp. GOD-11R]WPB55474.1 amino acid adenylation domain-containing protein [Xylophilus sp. GOD-11R]
MENSAFKLNAGSGETIGLSIFDLLSPENHETAGPAGLRARLALDDDFLADCAKAGLGVDAPADAVLLGAWLFLQARWAGRTTATLHEERRPRPADASRVLLETLAVDLDTPAHGWLVQVQRSRMQLPADKTTGRTTATATDRAALWADGEATAGTPAAGLRFWIKPAGREAAELHLWADSTVVSQRAAEQLLAAVVDTARDMLSRPAARLSELRTLSKADEQLQRRQWMRPHSAWDENLTVHGVFSRQAAAHPDRIAVEDVHSRLSYAELERRSDALALRLRRRGIGAGQTVGVLQDRSVAAVTSLLAILKSGAAYLPLSTDFPPERCALMLEQAGARLVLVRSSELHHVPPGHAGMAVDMTVDASEAETATEPPSPADHGGAESLACVMYTSGSTGAPKGIEIRHGSILRLVVGIDYLELPAGEGFLHAAPLAFDASTLEIWAPLLNAGRCVVHDEAVPTGAGLARTIERHHVGSAWLTAGLFNAVVDMDPTRLAGLRQLVIGGEALSVPRVRRALAALPGLALSNGYGPTECTTFATVHRIANDLAEDAVSVPLGRPIRDTTLRILGPSLAMLPQGMVGELCIGGRGLARAYVGQPAMTAERFVADPFGAAGDRLYRTGDLARWLPDGTVEFLGRADGQVKIRGHRVETAEVEAAALTHPGVRSCAVVAQADGRSRTRLVIYLVAQGRAPSWSSLRSHMAKRLTPAMLPSTCVWLARLPVTPNGKLDRRALPPASMARPLLAQSYEEPRGTTEEEICVAFAQALGIAQVGRHDNFFDLGGDSLTVLEVLAALQPGRPRPLSANLFFRLPTPKALAEQLDSSPTAAATSAGTRATIDPLEPVALVAMAGRFPGAADVEQFWANLLAGRDTVSFFDDAELDPGVAPELRADPAYVRARGVLGNVEDFDPAFFGMSPREAQLMDPQQRVFLEICWEALERAGYVPDQAPGRVGVFGGMHNASYFRHHVQSRPDLVGAVGEFQVMLANEKDYLATRTAHRLNLTGPALSINTACSTSAVAIAQAFHALRGGQCDLALAGGVSITCPPRSGYLYQEGSMLSPDGHTRSFDAAAQGTVFSDGAAVVLMKRLSDAQADGDTVYAVIRSAAVNNDGGAKASFTAPSIDGQAAVIRAALQSAGIDPRSIGYVEAHGTATPMGDPVEIEALRSAWQDQGATTGGELGADIGYCTIGSLKSNVGHLVTAAGAAGVIKAALSLHEGVIAPTAHFTQPNPAIDFGRTPFRVSAELQPWPRSREPRRAAVSSFGVGGTNAHLILEEAPRALPADRADGPQLLVLSARSEAALSTTLQNLATHLERHDGLALADVAHTLYTGRKTQPYRCALVAADRAEAIATLRNADAAERATGTAPAGVPQPVLVFPGQGAQYTLMGENLYVTEPTFRAAFIECLTAFGEVLDFDLRERLFSAEPGALEQTSVTQPATFALEYGLARCLLSLGVKPVAFIGHSVGEFVAAVLAGVMSLRDAARLVARRGALMQALPGGQMLSVRLPADAVLQRLATEPELALAADNGPSACVVAGPADAVARFRSALAADAVDSRLLQTSHAFHSAMMDAAVLPFQALVRQVELRAPTTPIFSTLTGALLKDSEATDPGYWARHLRETVRFSPAVRAVLRGLAAPVFVEVGPRNTLATLIRQHRQPDTKAVPAAVSLLGDRPQLETRAWRLAAGRLWTLGVPIDLGLLDRRARKARVLLPTTPFERVRCWIDIAAPVAAAALTGTAPETVSPHLQETPMHDASSTAGPPGAALLPALRLLFEDVSGADLSTATSNTPFSELGFDSLTLTQVATQIKKRFQVAVTFRQLMEGCRSLDALAAHLAPLVSLPQPAAPARPAPLAAARPAAGIAEPQGRAELQQLLIDQMELMQRQLRMLIGAEPAAPSAAVSQPPVEAAPAAAEPVKYDAKKAFGAIARIHSEKRELSQRQQTRLNAFVRRYTERTPRSKAFTQDNREHMADPRAVNGFRPATKEITYQVVIERSKGSRLWDIDGNEYVDVLNGFGMNMFGWQPDFVQDAVRSQLDAGYEIGPQHPLAADVTRLICDLTGHDRAALCNTGSEAVMGALRIARTVTGRHLVVLFTGSYHGTFDEVLVRAGRNGQGLPAVPGVMPGMFGDVRVLDYGTPESLAFIAEHADELAAVLVEPIQSRRPDFQPREFLHAVRALTEASGTCLIFDEIITGFRASLGGAQQVLGVRADLVAYGKVIGGGFPVGVIAGSSQYMDALDGGGWQYGDDSTPSVGVTYFAGTFVRHPLALAAAKAALTHLKKMGPTLQDQLNLHTAAMADELNAFCIEAGAPLEVRYFSSLWRLHWQEDHPLQDLLFPMMRSRGVHILDNFPCFLTTAHTAEDIATIKSALKESVAEMQEAGFLPKRVPTSRAFDPAQPPIPGARPGRDENGRPAWFVPDASGAARFVKVPE